MKDNDMLDRWTAALNKRLRESKSSVVLPSCFGHMQGMSRWLSAKMDKGMVEENAHKVAACFLCPENISKRCSDLSLASYTFQVIPKRENEERELNLLEVIAEGIAEALSA